MIENSNIEGTTVSSLGVATTPSTTEIENEKYTELLVKYEELNEKYENLKAANSAPKKLTDYKTGDYVQVLGRTLTDWENGKVLESNKAYIIVGTAKGEISVGSLSNIRKQAKVG